MVIARACRREDNRISLDTDPGRFKKMNVTRALIAISVLALLASPSGAQDKPQTPPAGQPPGGPPLPKPGPEHQMLKQDEGVWDASVEAFMAPGAPPNVSKGTETNRLTGGGLWLVSDFKSEFMGQPFEGHGITGWDPAKKKFVGTWVDSMTTSLSVAESTYDPSTKTVTGWMEGQDENGKAAKMKTTMQWKDPDTRVFTMFDTKDGKETPTLRITYTRKK
jgi:Protein of unknown function (DUF1579)